MLNTKNITAFKQNTQETQRKNGKQNRRTTQTW